MSEGYQYGITGTGALSEQGAWWKGLVKMHYKDAIKHLQGQAPGIKWDVGKYQYLQANWQKYVLGSGEGDKSYDYAALQSYLESGHPSEIQADSAEAAQLQAGSFFSRRKGRGSTILTTPLGLTKEANLSKPTLLGQ